MSIEHCNLLHVVKFGVLQKIPKGRGVEDKDEFVFNENFSAPLCRMKVIYVLIMYTYTLDLIWSLGLNCCCALLSKCNSNEGDSRRKHERR